jgi:biotin carboxyl carrier protein
MPGLVLAVKVSPGDKIKKGEALIVLEAMKMENVLKAEADCVIKSIDCIIGSAAEKGQVLISFEA